MADSPWIEFPPSVDDPGMTYPIADQHIWVRMRQYQRRPFRAIWHTDGDFGGAPYAVVAEADWTEIEKWRVTWADLDSWQPDA